MDRVSMDLLLGPGLLLMFFCFSRRGPVTPAWTTARTLAVQLLPRRWQLAPESVWSYVPVVLSISPADELRATAYMKALVACGSADGESPEGQKDRNKCHSAPFTSTRDKSRMGRCVVAAVPRSGGGDARHATSH
jgi:hypothetical protein